MALPILLETPHVIIVHKPPGIQFHNNEQSLGVCNLLRRQLLAQNGMQENFRLYPVHRLDAMTSGCLMFAKHRDAARELASSFRSTDGVAKYYVALSRRKPSRKSGSIIGDMERSRRGAWKLMRTRTNPAITRFVSTTMSDEYHENQTPTRVFLLKPVTGKTHQIRVALKSLGSPVAGDVRYADAGQAKLEERGYLHCAALRTRLYGEVIQVKCAPDNGKSFTNGAFQSIFQGWFPDGMIYSHESWFPESKLLQSSI